MENETIVIYKIKNMLSCINCIFIVQPLINTMLILVRWNYNFFMMLNPIPALNKDRFSGDFLMLLSD